MTHIRSTSSIANWLAVLSRSQRCCSHTIHTPPLFLSRGKFFHNDTVKSPWRLDFGLLVHHLWKFSPAASLQFTFLIAMHNENKYQYYGIGPIILGKFDRSCLIWVYGFQLYLFTGKSIDFERNRMAPEIWLALRVEFGLISCFVVRTFLDYLIGYNLKISFSYCR